MLQFLFVSNIPLQNNRVIDDDSWSSLVDITDNVARCLSIVFNVVFTYFALGKSTSLLTCSTLLVVILGFYCGIEGEVDFSFLGTVAGVLASLFVSLNSIYTTKVLPKVDNDKSLLLYYNNLNASFLFLPLIVLFESQVIFFFVVENFYSTHSLFRLCRSSSKMLRDYSLRFSGSQWQ